MGPLMKKDLKLITCKIDNNAANKTDWGKMERPKYLINLISHVYAFVE